MDDDGLPSWAYLAAKKMVEYVQHVPAGPGEDEWQRAQRRRVNVVMSAAEALGLGDNDDNDKASSWAFRHVWCTTWWILPEQTDDVYTHGQAARAWWGDLPPEGEQPPCFMYVGSREDLEALAVYLERNIARHRQRPVRHKHTDEWGFTRVRTDGSLSSVGWGASTDGPLALAVYPERE